MRAKFLLIPTISVLGLGLMFMASTASADDVYVDLSVLDSLGENNSPVINNGPLFPIVKKVESRKVPAKTKVKPSPKATAKKISVKKAIVKKSPAKVTVPPKSEIKIEVRTPDVEEQKVIETVVSESSAPIVSDLSIKDSPFAVAPVEALKDEVSAAPIAPVEVKTEPLADVNDAPVIMEPLKGATLLPSAKPEVKSGAPESLFGTPQADEPTLPTAPASEVSNQETAPIQDNNSAVTAAPLVEAIPLETLPNAVSEVSKEIVFAADSYELDEEDKAQLDKLVASFENPHANKIAIFAFNIDDGKDVFRKKRLSLNRAIEVRSYLLGKGYKNYSIKVVNLEDANGKENKVIVEELK